MNKITLEVIGAALVSIADEMGVALIRSSYSSNIKERRDCSAAIFTADGELIAQAEQIPMHLGSLTGIVQEILKRYPVTALRIGDVFIANDPYNGGGTHLPDITVASPVFGSDGRLVAFVANIGHHADVGNNAVRSIYDEGLRIPPVRIVEGDRIREDVFEFLLLNYRVPSERRGDFRAQFAANRLGAKRIAELIDRYGPDVVLSAMDALLDYGERKLRAAVASLPDGEYRFTDFLDGDGIDPDPIPIAVRVLVRGDQIELDFTGSGRQVLGDINAVWNATLATAYYALKALLDSTIPPNGGFHRGVRVIAPAGTIVNASPPGAVAWRTQTCQRIADVIFGALAPALGDRAIAAGNGANCAMSFTGLDPLSGRFYCYLETVGGGSGARASKDGLDAVQVHITNASNLPVEALELEYPLLVREYALVEGSGGAGKWRGGLGIRRSVEVLNYECVFVGHIDRARFGPWGLNGGGKGGKGRIVLNAGTDKERVLPGKIWGFLLRPGDVVTVETPGAGGFGPPDERDDALAARDIRHGLVGSP